MFVINAMVPRAELSALMDPSRDAAEVADSLGISQDLAEKIMS